MLRFRVHTRAMHTYIGQPLIYFKHLRDLLRVIRGVVKGEQSKGYGIGPADDGSFKDIDNYITVVTVMSVLAML
jgi:hypothetical protein